MLKENDIEQMEWELSQMNAPKMTMDRFNRMLADVKGCLLDHDTPSKELRLDIVTRCNEVLTFKQ